MSFRFGEGDVSVRDQKGDLKKKKKTLSCFCFCFCFLRSIGFYNLYLVGEKRIFFFLIMLMCKNVRTLKKVKYWPEASVL